MPNEVIESPAARIPFLRYKIGRTETRPEQIATYKRRGDGTLTYFCTGFRPGESRINVFRLIAFGANKDQAEAMLERNK